MVDIPKLIQIEEELNPLQDLTNQSQIIPLFCPSSSQTDLTQCFQKLQNFDINSYKKIRLTLQDHLSQNLQFTGISNSDNLRAYYNWTLQHEQAKSIHNLYTESSIDYKYCLMVAKKFTDRIPEEEELCVQDLNKKQLDFSQNFEQIMHNKFFN